MANSINISTEVSLTKPAYWQSYRLNEDPFSIDSPESYYPVTQWEQQLDLIQHLLIHYSNLLLCITGQAGCGKTTLLQQFMQQIDA